MEQGRFLASSTGDMPAAYLEFYAETEFENKKGLLGAFRRKSISIKDPKGGYYANSYYCAACGLVFGEFPTKKKKS